jgi:mRNA-degrading endonuclease RelE of RelBE toxin-antitoxin system
MQIEFTKKFGRQVDKYRDKKVRKNLSEVIDNILEASNIYKIKNLKKLKGHKSFYRIISISDFRCSILKYQI